MTTDAEHERTRTSRRDAGCSRPPRFAGGTAAFGFPAVVRAQTPVKWRIQTAWDAGTAGYTGVPEVLREA